MSLKDLTERALGVLLKRRLCLEIAVASATFPLLNIIIFNALHLYPSHDSLVFTQKMYAITQSLHFGKSLITYLPNIRFGIVSSAFDTVSIESLPALIISSIFNLAPSTLFNVYYLTSSLVLGLFWQRIFHFLGISKSSGIFGLIIIGTINFPLWQVWFNYQLFFQVTFLLLAIVSLKVHHERRWFIFLSVNALCIPLGHPFYFSIFIYYLEIFILLLIRKEVAPLRDFIIEFKRLSTWVFFSVYGVIFGYIAITLKSILESEALVISPGARNADGTTTFNDFLNYGGASGPLKLLSILGGSTAGSLDFTLFTSLVALPILYWVVISKVYSKKEGHHLPFISIFSGILILTYPIPFLARIMYELPGMDYLRHLSYFSATVKPFVVLLTIQVIDKLNFANIKRLFFLTSITCLFLFVEKPNKYVVALFIIFILGNWLTSRGTVFQKTSKFNRDILARQLLFTVIMLSNFLVFYLSSPVGFSKLPLIEIYSKSQEIKLDKSASDSLTASYLALSTSSTMTTYDALALQLKRIYCIDLTSIKDAKNAPIRSDLESKSLRLERNKYEEICKLGGARFWQWDGESLTPATAKFQLSVYPEITKLHYEILNFKLNREYFVELSQARWSIRDAHSMKLQTIRSVDVCRSCVSFQLKSKIGNIDVVTQEVWRMVQLLFLCIATAYFLFTAKVIMNETTSVKVAMRRSRKN